MPDRSRISKKVEAFNSYLTNTSDYMLAGNPSNAARLGLLPAEVAKWTAFVPRWQPLYTSYSDQKTSRTTAIKDQLLSVISDCTKLDQASHILDRIAASPNVTIVDMETFNIKKGILQKTGRTIPKIVISEPVSASIQPLGGGAVSIKCHSSKAGRPSVFTGADSVQFAWQVGDTIPTSADTKGLYRDISSRASFVLNLHADSSGKYLYIFFRWYHTKYPKLAGPWSSLQTSLIL